MVRAIAGVVGGFVAWMFIATVGNLAMRIAWTSYADVEAAMTFTPTMLTARLVLGAVCSLGAGWVVAWIARRNRGAISALVVVLIVVFVPVHHELWEKFPLWYHAIFFLSLVVMTLLGTMLSGKKTGERIGRSAGNAQDRQA